MSAIPDATTTSSPRYARERATDLPLPPQPAVDALLRSLAAEGVPSTLVRALPASEALAMFVGSPAHRGIPLNLYRLG